jgi:hypothetical protein
VTGGGRWLLLDGCFTYLEALYHVGRRERKRGFGERDSGAAGGVAELVPMANAYHEFSEPQAMLWVAPRALKPNGRLVALEYAKENSRVPIILRSYGSRRPWKNGLGRE